MEVSLRNVPAEQPCSKLYCCSKVCQPIGKIDCRIAMLHILFIGAIASGAYFSTPKIWGPALTAEALLIAIQVVCSCKSGNNPRSSVSTASRTQNAAETILPI